MSLHSHYCATAVPIVLLAAIMSNIASGEIRVALRPDATVVHETVTIGDVANVVASDEQVAELVRALDVDILRSVGDEAIVSRRQVEIRVLLEQLERLPPRVEGVEKAVVRRVEPPRLVDSVVEQQLTQAFAQFWGLPAEQISLQLATPLERLLPASFTPLPGDRLEPMLQPSMLPGNLRVPVGVYRDRELVETFYVPVMAYVEREVAIARRVIRLGDAIEEDSLRFVVQRLSGRTALEAVSREALGKYTTRTMTAGTLVRRSTFQATPPRQPVGAKAVDDSPMMPARSTVTLIARRNGLEARYGGAQLQRPTRVGQNTVVKNNAGVDVEGTLISPGEVLVTLR
jgi:flagella basal body P-ring formation protein FlgA